MNSIDEWLYPEIRVVPDQRERAAVFSKLARGKRRVLGFLLFALLIFCTMALIDSFAPVLFGDRVTTLILMGTPVAAIGGVLISVVGALVSRKRDRAILRRCLVEAGYLVCLGCGYDLRGQTISRCPECGVAFDAQPSHRLT